MRLVAAIVVTLVISTILAPVSSVAPASLEPIFAGIALLHIEGAVSWLVAVAVGAMVARKSFVMPSVLLSVALWAIVSYIVYDIARVAEQTSVLAIAAQQLPVLVLMTTAAIIGALIGRWFFQQHLQSYLEAA